MTAPHRVFGYAIEYRKPADEGRVVAVAVFKCTRCTATIERNLPTTGKHNPELIAKNAAVKGWKVDAFVATRVFCPDCNGTPMKTKKESDVSDRTAKPARLTLAAGTAAAQPPAPAEDRPLPAPGIMTAERRAAIRDLLGTYFDAAHGEYIGGADDASIATETGATIEQVAGIREAAFGPILVTPAVQAARAELAKLIETMAVLDGKYRELLAQADAAVSELAQARIAAVGLAKQIGGMS